ncbi:MAG: GNAT family N-acetyltransferase [Gemmatimonadales bacterium]
MVADRVSRIRLLEPGDRGRVEAMTRATGFFYDAEIGIALEVFDAATGAGPDGTIDPDYETAGIESDGVLAAWACWGPVPEAPETFDLYWIVVDPAAQGCGYGTKLLQEMDRRIAGRATQVLVETSGRPDYAGTRAFYERHGYRQIAQVPDHFAPGDDLVRYARDVRQVRRS